MKRASWIIAALLLAAYLATGLYQVRPGERAVVRRFGRVLDEPRLPGLNLGLPFGLDQVDRIAVDEQRQITVGFQDIEQEPLETAPPGQLLTGDNNLLDIRAMIYYRIEPDRVAEFALNADRVEGVVSRAAEVALAQSLAGQRIDAVLLGRASDLELHVQRHLADTVSEYRLGLAIETVNVTYAQPPAELAEVFRDVNRARTQREIAEREALGEKQANLSAARMEARRTNTAAQVTYNQRVTQARAEAQNFLALWRKYRDYTSDRSNALLNLYLTEMQTVLSRLQVRTVSDKNVEQTIIMPGPEK